MTVWLVLALVCPLVAWGASCPPQGDAKSQRVQALNILKNRETALREEIDLLYQSLKVEQNLQCTTAICIQA